MIIKDQNDTLHEVGYDFNYCNTELYCLVLWNTYDILNTKYVRLIWFGAENLSVSL